MGKIRVTTIGDETAEDQQKEKQKKRKEAKRIEDKKTESLAQSAASAAVSDVATGDKTKQSHKEKPRHSGENPEPAEGDDSRIKDEKQDAELGEEKTSAKGRSSSGRKKEKFLKKKASSRSKKYQDVAALVDKKKIYSLKEALAILPKLKLASFDETVELHINTLEAGISGSMVLPHGTGKKTRIAIVNAAKDPKSVDDILKQVETGKINFDILIATPDSMPKLARVAKFLGPRGLMPNPKNGTITPKPEEVAKKFEGGQLNFKTEAKSPIIHLVVGKMSFGDTKLTENIKVAFASLPANKLQNATLKSTMSPGLKLDFTSI